MTENARSRRSARCGAGAALVMALVTVAGGVGAAAPAAPASVFDESRTLAIEAARTRLRLFAGDFPEAADGTAPTDRPECPALSAESASGLAAAVGAEQGAGLTLQLDPWLARTTSDPELRPDSAAPGTVLGIPIVRCETVRPGDGELVRPSLLAIVLGDGVSFGDVVRLENLEGLLRVRPAAIGGELVGSCQGTEDTAVCVALWHSRNLVIGLSLEGPPAAVNTATAGALLAASVPVALDTLAVVIRPAPVCSADTIRADTGVVLIEEPTCDAGWAFGSTVECTSDLGCESRNVFHVEPDGWVHNGSIDITCTEALTRLGMTVVTAGRVAPQSCEADDPSLSTGSIRPGRQGTRVAALQIALVDLGYDLPVDGRYGPLTTSAVIDFQQRNGLIVDGIAGAQTRSSLGI